MAINSGKKIRKRLTDMGTVIQTIFADLASTIRVAESGLDLQPVGALGTTQKRVNQNTPVLVYNPTAGDLFVAFGDDGVSAPTSAANGIPVLKDGTTVMLNSGDKIWIRGSATGLFAYTGDN